MSEDFEEYNYNLILLYDNTLRYVDEAIKSSVVKLKKKLTSLSS